MIFQHMDKDSNTIQSLIHHGQVKFLTRRINLIKLTCKILGDCGQLTTSLRTYTKGQFGDPSSINNSSIEIIILEYFNSFFSYNFLSSLVGQGEFVSIGNLLPYLNGRLLNKEELVLFHLFHF